MLSAQNRRAERDGPERIFAKHTHPTHRTVVCLCVYAVCIRISVIMNTRMQPQRPTAARPHLIHTAAAPAPAAAVIYLHYIVRSLHRVCARSLHISVMKRNKKKTIKPDHPKL